MCATHVILWCCCLISPTSNLSLSLPCPLADPTCQVAAKLLQWRARVLLQTEAVLDLTQTPSAWPEGLPTNPRRQLSQADCGGYPRTPSGRCERPTRTENGGSAPASPRPQPGSVPSSTIDATPSPTIVATPSSTIDANSSSSLGQPTPQRLHLHRLARSSTVQTVRCPPPSRGGNAV
jgi:hypothetical protein